MSAARKGIADWKEVSEVAEEIQQGAAYSLPYPEGFIDGQDAGIDHAEVKTDLGILANQSVLTLITKAGSSVEFHGCQGEYDSESREDKVHKGTLKGVDSFNSLAMSSKDYVNETLGHTPSTGHQIIGSSGEHTHESIPKQLTIDGSSRAQTRAPKPATSQELEAKQNIETSCCSRRVNETTLAHKRQDPIKTSSTLADQLKTIFGFQNCQEVIADFPCWLTQNISFQGHMYVTQHNVCFYAYVPNRTGVIVKSGYLAKRGKQNLTYSRYWFQLRGHELLYRTDPSDPYFRSGNVDLRDAVSAALRGAKVTNKATREFYVVTSEREYHFRADSYSNAREWVKQLQRVIFRIHNGGDSVKISMPIVDIMDVEEAPVTEVAETIRIRVANADESLLVFALEEYFFTFFSNGKGALTLLNDVMRDNIPSKLNDVHSSSSQFLDRSDMFQSPTIRQGDTTDKTEEKTSNADLIPTALSGKSGSPIRTKPHETGGGSPHGSNTPLILRQAVTATSLPLRKAGRLADYVRERSKRMSNLLASESIVYVEKVSGMLAGGQKHYNGTESLMGDDITGLSQTEDQHDGSGDRFRAYFALKPSERLRAVYFAYLHRGIPLYGKLYLSDRKVCFRSLMTKTKMVLPFKDIETVNKEKGFRFGYCGLVVVVRGHEELFFDFRSHEIRDDCTVTILRSLNSSRTLMESDILSQEDQEEAQVAKDEHRRLSEANNLKNGEHRLSGGVKDDILTTDKAPVLFDDPRASMLDFKPTASLKITCLTIGSRGDVQPYIALCKGLMRDGHEPRIATHSEFGSWIKGHGISFAPVDGDPAELMRICVENGMFTYSFLKEASAKFRGWIDGLLTSAWKACQNTDLLIESPSAMAGAHIAEALGIPYFKAFTMPWTRTRTYPHAFAIPSQKRGGTYNELSYYVFDQVFWKAIAGQVNRWREKELGLRSTDLARMSPHRVPFLYNFSPSVVVPPLDFSSWVHVTGYWVLDEATDWKPGQDLVDFIAKARADDKKLVYIGFGSVVVSDPATLTKTVVDSVLKADVRCILSKGWSDRLGTMDAMLSETPLPPEILQIRSVPHDWLFVQVDAAVHHGGAGTTGASLRAGLPTIIKPFFGDQHFFGSRIEDLGVGICLRKMNISLFSRALWEVTRNLRIITKAAALGKRIRDEDGVGTAIQTIYRELDYARSLIRHADDLTSNEDLIDEDWTLIGDEDEPEISGSGWSVGPESRKGSLDLGA